SRLSRFESDLKGKTATDILPAAGLSSGSSGQGPAAGGVAFQTETVETTETKAHGCGTTWRLGLKPIRDVAQGRDAPIGLKYELCDQVVSQFEFSDLAVGLACDNWAMLSVVIGMSLRRGF